MTKAFIPLVIAITSLTGCKSDTTQTAIASSIKFDRQNTEQLISESPINIGEALQQSEVEYLDQVYFSIAKGIAKRAGHPRYMKMSFTLTPAMYDGDLGGFVVVLDTTWLIAKGALPTEAENVAVLSTNNMWNSHISYNMDFASYNKMILDAIALSQVEQPLTDKQKLFRISSQQPLVNFNGFTDDKIDNLNRLNYVIFRSDRKASFDPLNHFRRGYVSHENTSRRAFFVKVNIEQAIGMLGQTYALTFLPVAVFEIKATGQIVVLATRDAALLDSTNNQIRGVIDPNYIYEERMFEPKNEHAFRCERVKSYIRSDQVNAPFVVRKKCK